MVARAPARKQRTDNRGRSAGARGAVLLEACVPASEFGDGWPAGVPVQVHGMEHDPFFGLEVELIAVFGLAGLLTNLGQLAQEVKVAVI